MTLAGIDVSAYQGDFDWQAWKGKIAFAGIKISEGTTYADPDAKANIAGARAIGAKVMGYHFLHAADSGDAQADHFMDCAKAAKMERGDLMAVDVEQGGLAQSMSADDLWSVAAAFAAAIHDHFGAWPVIYTDITMGTEAPNMSALVNCPLWLANPSGTPVTSIGPWNIVSFEQTGQSGVDTDVFYGDLDQLKRLAVP